MLIAVESSAILSSLVFQLCKETMISSVLLHSATQQSQFYQTSSDTPARNSPNSAKLMTNETWHISQNLKSFWPRLACYRGPRSGSSWGDFSQAEYCWVLLSIAEHLQSICWVMWALLSCVSITESFLHYWVALRLLSGAFIAESVRCCWVVRLLLSRIRCSHCYQRHIDLVLY